MVPLYSIQGIILFYNLKISPMSLKGYTTANEPHYNDGYFGVKSNLASSDHGKVEENLAIYVVATFLAIIIKSRWAT